MSDHARFAPSAAHRWLNCTASVDAASHYSDPQSFEAAEGTAAHFLLERCLVDGGDPADHLGRTIVTRENHVERKFVIDKDMAQDVAIATEFIRGVVARPGFSGVESRVDLNFLEVGTFGTADLWHWGEDGVFTVADFKYGRGDVDVIQNPQLMLYALGLIEPYRNSKPHSVHLAIIQPRSVMPVPRIKTWTFPLAKIYQIAADAHDAITEANRNPQFKTGAWCKHCPALGHCPATEDAATALAPSLLTADMTVADAARIMERKDLLEKIVGRAEKLLLEAALRGVKVPGYKLVTGIKHRQWRDENLAKQRLADEFGADCLKAPTPSAAEKLGHSARKITAELAYTPPGDPVVAREDDKRSPYVAKTADAMFGASS